MATYRVLIPTEDQEQTALIQWAMTQPGLRDVILHISNERQCTPRQGAKFKRLGVRRGVSDIFIPIPVLRDNGFWQHGLWIELKRQKYFTITIEQQEWIDKMRNLEYAAEICCGWEKARDTIISYLSLR